MKIYRIKSVDKLDSVFNTIKSAGFVVFDIESESLDFRSRIQSIQLFTKYKNELTCFYIPLEDINRMRLEPDTVLINAEQEKMHKDGQLTAFDTTAFIKPVHIYEPVEKFLDYEDIHELICGVFGDPEIKKVAHNMKFDAKFLLAKQVKIVNWHFDTMLAAWQTNEKRYSYELKVLIKKYEDIDSPTWKALTKPVREKYFNLEYSVQQKYACDDPYYTYLLWQRFSPEIFKTESSSVFFRNQMMRVSETLAHMELYGACVDTGYALRKHNAYQLRLTKVVQYFDVLIYKSKYTGTISITSDDDLLLFFYYHLKYPQPKFAKNKNVDKHTMKFWAKKGSRIAKTVLLYRKIVGLDKFVNPDLKGSILANTDMETGILYPNFNQHKTKMHRLSSSEPNTQNLPRGGNIRKCIVASEGTKLMAVDYSQIELRCFAHYSKDPMFLSAYSGNNLIDIHEQTRQSVIEPNFPELSHVEQRTLAKNCNFGIWYGVSPWGLAKLLGVSEYKAEAILSGAFKYYSVNKEWVEWAQDFVQENGWVGNCYGGRRRFYNVDWSDIDKGLKAYYLREAVHFIISSTAACILKDRMNIIDDKYADDPNVNMILQIHDELIIEIADDHLDVAVPDICNILERPDGIFNVPLKVDYKLLDKWSK